jgi:hypothetical protein
MSGRIVDARLMLASRGEKQARLEVSGWGQMLREHRDENRRVHHTEVSVLSSPVPQNRRKLTKTVSLSHLI